VVYRRSGFAGSVGAHIIEHCPSLLEVWPQARPSLTIVGPLLFLPPIFHYDSAMLVPVIRHAHRCIHHAKGRSGKDNSGGISRCGSG
jgi:hypothetical protein